MTTWQLLTSAWDWEPTVLAGCAALLTGYALIVRPLTARAWCFGSGALVLLLALVSPLDTLGDTYLLSAHMLQHMLLILVVPPLLILGIPPDVWARLWRWAPARRAERVLGRPPRSWLIGMCTLWLWHAPTLYDAAVANEEVHIFEHLCFLVTATIFWWPVITPLAERRLAPIAAIAYLVPAIFANDILGVIITFAPPGLYPVYEHPVDWLGALSLIRQGWSLSYATDQQVGGLIMWVMGSPVFLLACLWSLSRWFREPDEADIMQSLPAPQARGTL